MQTRASTSLNIYKFLVFQSRLSLLMWQLNHMVLLIMDTLFFPFDTWQFKKLFYHNMWEVDECMFKELNSKAQEEQLVNYNEGRGHILVCLFNVS